MSRKFNDGFFCLAPWNSMYYHLDKASPCHNIREIALSPSDYLKSDWLANLKKDFIEYTRCTGTLAMYGVFQYAKFLGKKTVCLSSHKGTRKFYAKLGMKEKRMVFYSYLAEGLPKGLLERMQASFPLERTI